MTPHDPRVVEFSFGLGDGVTRTFVCVLPKLPAATRSLVTVIAELEGHAKLSVTDATVGGSGRSSHAHLVVSERVVQIDFQRPPKHGTGVVGKYFWQPHVLFGTQVQVTRDNGCVEWVPIEDLQAALLTTLRDK